MEKINQKCLEMPDLRKQCKSISLSNLSKALVGSSPKVSRTNKMEWDHRAILLEATSYIYVIRKLWES
jgi:hypothetical protein